MREMWKIIYNELEGVTSALATFEESNDELRVELSGGALAITLGKDVPTVSSNKSPRLRFSGPFLIKINTIIGKIFDPLKAPPWVGQICSGP